MRPPPPNQPRLRRSQLLRWSAAGLASVPLDPALAWCNGYFEGKISNDVAESAVPFVSGSYSTNVFVRNVRPPSRRVMGGSVSFPVLPPLPPVVVIGTPGVTYDYLENLQALALSGRRVLMLGTCEAPSDRPWWPPADQVGPLQMRLPRVAAQQVRAACESCGFRTVHLFGHGLGGAVALHLVQQLRAEEEEARAAAAKAAAAASAGSKLPNDASADAAASAGAPLPPRLRLASVALSSPYGALDDLRPAAQRRIQSWDDQFPMDGDEGGGIFEGEQCVTEASLLTDFPYREAMLRVSRAEAAAERLGGSRLASRLPQRGSGVPVLLCRGGSADLVDPSWDLGGREADAGDVRLREFPFAGHLPFIDSREEFLAELLDFYSAVDGGAVSGAAGERGVLAPLESNTAGGRRGA